MGRRHAEVKVAVSVHGRYLEHGDIRRIDMIVIVAGQFRIAHRLIEASAGINVLALEAAGVVGVVDDMADGIFNIEDRRLPKRDAPTDLYVLQLRSTAGQGLVQYARMRCTKSIIDPITGLDYFHGFICRSQFGPIHPQKLFECHFDSPPVSFLFYPCFFLSGTILYYFVKKISTAFVKKISILSACPNRDCQNCNNLTNFIPDIPFSSIFSFS